MTVEIVAASLEDALEAEAGGADRIELCSAMVLGGLTPSFGAVELVAAAVSIPVVAMIRPRGGGFAYSSRELAVMECDIEATALTPVFGVLTDDGRIDESACRRLIARTGRRPVFHRAFDVTPDPFEALETLIDLGFARVLTSGQGTTAMEGADLIRRLIERADGRIEVLPGGGIRAHNVAEVIAKTGSTQVHLSAFRRQTDPSVKHAQLTFNAGGLPEDQFDVVDRQVVADVVAATRRD